MQEKVYCSDCGIEMQFHPVTSDYTLTAADLLSEEEMLNGILDEFYSCPDCGKTAVPNEKLFAQQAKNAYACHLAVATELF
jgi:predicted RNA-binding Zn-ribbon protein involved in translation (DUF1610 family)